MEIKCVATGSLFPAVAHSDRCTLVLLSNLAEPDWIQINCTEQLLAHGLCSSSGQTLFSKDSDDLEGQFDASSIETGRNGKIVHCPPGNVLTENLCHLFIWNYRSETVNVYDTCQKLKMMDFSPENISTFQYIFEAVNVQFPSIVFPHHSNASLVQATTFHKYLNVFNYKSKTRHWSKAQGFQICQTMPTQWQGGGNTFVCLSGHHVSVVCVCDGVVDCLEDESDESHCTSKRNANCIRTRYPHNLCYKTHEQFTSKFLLEPVEGKQLKDRNSFVCDNNSRIDRSLVDDLVSDCGANDRDEPLLLLLLVAKMTFVCENSHQLPCLQGHSKCFNISFVCTYKLDEYQHNFPCRNGGHLANCRYFVCNLQFKCKHTYCIPWQHVCDGKWDCSTGNDEQCGEKAIRSCTYMYKCRSTTQMCIHLGNVCDDEKNCILADDESLCELSSVVCPKMCKCLALALSCENTVFYKGACFPFLSVNIFLSEITSLNNIRNIFPDTLFLHLLANNLSEVCNSAFSLNTVFANFGQNQIAHIDAECFIKHRKIRALLLDQNQIALVESLAFCCLPHLQFLSLSQNPFRVSL